MQIVIDKDKEINKLKEMLDTLTDEKDLQSVRFAINIFENIDGIPLPKHGKLVDIGGCDRKYFYKECGGWDSLITVKTAFDMLEELPVIIEANKEVAE